MISSFCFSIGCVGSVIPKQAYIFFLLSMSLNGNGPSNSGRRKTLLSAQRKAHYLKTS
jgi:hypothetical protein